MGRKPNPNKKEKVKNLKTIIEDPSLINLANEVITKNKLDYLTNIRIKYVFIDQYISKTTVAKCIRSSKELKHFANIDYIIEISKSVYDKVDDETRSLIMFHELLHILLTTNKQGDTVNKIMQHDIQDFSTIINKHGVKWIKELKTAVTSIMDIDITKADDVKI